MAKLFITLLLCLQLLAPYAVHAQTAAQAAVRPPYTLTQMGLMLGLSLLGGLASWWSKVLRGELHVRNITSLVGELSISAFAGLITFMICDYLRVDPALTPAIVGMAGHAGGKGIDWLEKLGKKSAEKAAAARFGIDMSDTTKDAK